MRLFLPPARLVPGARRSLAVAVPLLGAGLLAAPASGASATGPDLQVQLTPLMPSATVTVGELNQIDLQWKNSGDAPAQDVALVVKVTGGAAVLDVVPDASHPANSCSTTHTGNDAAARCELGDVAAKVKGTYPLRIALTKKTRAVVTVGLVSSSPDPTPGNALRSTGLKGEGPDCTLVGTTGADLLVSTAGDDVICGPRDLPWHEDTIEPRDGNDVIVASGLLDYSKAPGPLRVTGGPKLTIRGWGTDTFPAPPTTTTYGTLRASEFADQLLFDGRLSVEAGPGDDTITAAAVDAADLRGGYLDGGTGTDTLKVTGKVTRSYTIDLTGDEFFNIENVITGAGSQYVRGSGQAETISTGADPDRIDVSDGIGGNDVVDAGADRDTCTADIGDTVLNCEDVRWVPVLESAAGRDAAAGRRAV